MKMTLIATALLLSIMNVGTSYASEPNQKNCKVSYDGIDSDSENKSEELLDSIVITELMTRGYVVSDADDANFTLVVEYVTNNNEKKYSRASCEVIVKLTKTESNDDETTIALIGKSNKAFKLSADKEANCQRKLKRAVHSLPACLN